MGMGMSISFKYPAYVSTDIVLFSKMGVVASTGQPILNLSHFHP